MALNLSPETSCSRLWIRKTLPTSFVQPNPDNCIAPVPTSAPTIKGATYAPSSSPTRHVPNKYECPYLVSQGLCKVATYRDSTNAIVTYGQYNYFCTCPFEVIYQNANGLEPSTCSTAQRVDPDPSLPQNFNKSWCAQIADINCGDFPLC